MSMSPRLLNACSSASILRTPTEMDAPSASRAAAPDSSADSREPKRLLNPVLRYRRRHFNIEGAVIAIR